MTHHGDESQHHDDQHLAPSPDEPVGGTLGTTGTEGNGMPEQALGEELDSSSSGVPGDQVTSGGGVSADPLDGQNATGGYGDESTGLSDAADRDPAEDSTDVNGGNADR